MRLALLLALLLPVAACDTVTDAVDNAACQASGYADGGTLRATVSGDSFSGTCIRVQLQSGVLTVAGADNVVSNNNQELITLTFPTTDTASYTLGSSAAVASFTRRTEDSSDQANEVYAATSGTVTLAEYSATTARGTFSFSARNAAGTVVTVASGTFDVTF